MIVVTQITEYSLLSQFSNRGKALNKHITILLTMPLVFYRYPVKERWSGLAIHVATEPQRRVLNLIMVCHQPMV
jgi:hypothetical protein